MKASVGEPLDQPVEFEGGQASFGNVKDCSAEGTSPPLCSLVQVAGFLEVVLWVALWGLRQDLLWETVLHRETVLEIRA